MFNRERDDVVIVQETLDDEPSPRPAWAQPGSTFATRRRDATAPPDMPALVSLGIRTQELAPAPGERLMGRKSRIVSAEFYYEERHPSRLWIRWQGDTMAQPYGERRVGGGDDVIKVDGWIAKHGFESRWPSAPDDPPPYPATV